MWLYIFRQASESIGSRAKTAQYTNRVINPNLGLYIAEHKA